MFRAGPAVVIPLKPPLVTTTAGALKFARLKMLKKSTWNRNLNRSLISNCLRAEISQVFKGGPWIIPTPAVPHRVCGAAANAVGLTQVKQGVVEIVAGHGPGLDTNTGPPT